jgi:hypothetical protein
MGAFQSGFGAGLQRETNEKQQKKSRQEQLQDQQRNDKLSVYTDLFHDDRISPAEMAHAVEDIYHDAEPEKKMTMLGRIMNHKKAKQQAADAAKGKQTRGTEEQGIIAGAKTPQQVSVANATAGADADTAKKKAAIQALPALFPDATPEQLSEMKERILAPGAVHRPSADENKRQDYRAAVEGGYKGSFEKWVAEQSATGRAAGTASKPVFKVVRGHEVLIDPKTQKITKDFGPTGSAKVSKREAIQYDNDGNPHVVTLTTVSSPEGGNIEVDTEGEAGDGKVKGPAPRKAATPKPNAHGDLDFRKATPQSNKAKAAVDTAEAAYDDVQKASKDPTPVGDQGVILAWLRGRVNRVTASEIAAVNNLGGAEMKLEGNIVRIVSGKMTDQQRKWFLKSAKDNFDNAKDVASKYSKPAPEAGASKKIVVTPEDMK